MSNNVENDNDDYVYLKRPYLFNIRYNSRQVWNKLPDEEKAPYVNYEEYYEECRLIKLRSIGYPILAGIYMFCMLVMVLYIIYVFSGFNIFSLFVYCTIIKILFVKILHKNTQKFYFVLAFITIKC